MEPKIPDQLKPYLIVAKSSANLLLFLSNDLLDYSQIEAGRLKLTFEQFDVYNSCFSLVELLRNKAESKGLKLLLSETLKGILIR